MARSWTPPPAPPAAAAAAPTEHLAAIEEICGRGYKAAARVHHPDTGGSDEAMNGLNAAVGWLREHLLGGGR
jgi:hypothetical protein